MINKACLLGRVGKKDTKTLKNGSTMTNLYIATSRKYKDSAGENQEITVWHNVNFFNKIAEVVSKYAHVGDLVYVEGEISNKQITQGDKQGQWAYSVTGSEIKFIPSTRKKTDEPKKEKKVFDDTGFDDDMIPF